MARLIEQFYVLILALVFSITAYAQSIGESPKPFQMGEVRTIHSEVLGRSYDLFVKLPPGYQEAFAKRLRSRGYENLDVRDEIMEGGTHLSTFPIGLTRALRWLLPGSKIYAG